MESVWFVILYKDYLSKVSIGAFLAVCEKVSETLNKRIINIEIALIIMLSLYFIIYPCLFSWQLNHKFTQVYPLYHLPLSFNVLILLVLKNRRKFFVPFRFASIQPYPVKLFFWPVKIST